MTEMTGLTIVIDGDISGLTDAIEDAQKKINDLSKYTDVGFAGGVYSKAKKRFNHWANSGQSSIDEQIKWWEKARDYYYYDPSVWWESQERIYDLNRSKVSGFNNIADDYIRDSKYFTSSDEAINTFKEISGLNWIFADKGVIDWDEYDERVSELGEEMYRGRIAQSEKWLSEQEKYHALSVEDYIDGLLRMEQYTEEYFNAGLIDYELYVEGKRHINDEIFAKRNEIYKAWESSASNWKEMRDTYGDWEEYGDSVVLFYQRCIERVGEMYREGNISWQTYMDDTMNYQMRLFEAQSARIEGIFSDMSSYITKLQNQYRIEEETLKDTWDSADRNERLGELSHEILIYRGAVTEKGKDKYESLLDEQKRLKREEEMYELQKTHNNTISNLQKQYERMENNKNNILRMIRNTELDLSDITDKIGVNLTLFGGRSEQLMYSLISEVRSAGRNAARANSYSDNRVVNISAQYPSGILPSISHILTGLGNVMTKG